MLEIFDQNPQSRVFHLDKECYVVYLGAHWEDYRPFLRIGTSTELPDALPPIVSTIVVPDDLTGNPLEEAACLTGDGTAETHYVGEAGTVEAVKSFVGRDSMPVGALQEADTDEDDGRHVLVYYYKDGNLKVKYRKSEVWDLRRREKSDGHFVGRAQEAKNAYGRGPFKFPGQVYQDTGFLVANGTPYLVSKGELAALTLKKDYFFDLCAAGVDADRVTTVRVDSPDASLVRFFKRSRLRDRVVRVATPNKQEVQALASIFTENTLPPLQVKVLEGSGGAFTFQNYSVTQATGRFEAQLEGLDGPVVFSDGGKKQNGSVVIDQKSSKLTVAGGFSAEVLDGCVYHISRKLPTRTDIDADYLPEKNYPYRDLLPDSENNLIYQLNYYFNEVFGGRDPGKVMKTIKSLDATKSIGRTDGGLHPVTQVLLHNYAQYALYIRDHEPQAAKGVDPLISLLKNHELRNGEIPEFMPLVGTLVIAPDERYLFYQFAARITSDRFAHAPAVVEQVKAEPIIDYVAERERLSDLIAGLATPEQMDEARMRRIAESQKKKEQPKKQPEEPKTTEVADAAAGTGGFRGPSTRAPAKKKKQGNRWLLPVGGVVLLLLIIGALLFTNVIPNPWFADEPAVVADGTTDAEDGTAGTDGDGTDAVGDDGDPVATGDGTGTGGEATQGEDGDADAGDTADGDDVQVPEGWPQESVPALRALEEMPDVVISDSGVTGPGGIEITINDIIRLVNRIATENGYAPMGADVVRSRDPDWIFPGSVFELPNGTSYTVERGDTLWDITVRFMIARLRQDYNNYLTLAEEYEQDSTSTQRRDEIEVRLEEIASESHTENLAALIREQLQEWD